MSLRNFTRASATAVLAAGALALSATPALAADVDFGLSLTGTTIAADATGKLGTIGVTNNGTTKPEKVELVFDLSKVDDSKIEVTLAEHGEGCRYAGDIVTCEVDEYYIPGPGKTSELGLPLTRQPDATGAAGKITITVKVEGDSNKSNDSKTADINVGKNGVDLTVIAPDVTGVNQETGEPTDSDVKPGEVAVAWAFVWNQGDRIADGLRVEVKLPKDVTFADEEEGCTYAADNRSVKCDYEEFSLLPGDQDGTGEDSSAGFFFPVRVAEDAKGPVALKGGEVTITAIEQVSVSATNKKQAQRKSVVPANAKRLTAAQAALEVDATDNSDAFAVLVAGPTGGSGGGDGDGGDGPGLPVTGPVAATAAGLGAAVLAVGAFLFVSARRRRVVLVTPGDGK